MLSCLTCGEEAFLVRGLCQPCAPLIHENWRTRVDLYATLAIMFERETGRSALEDWYGFEAWMERKGDP